MHEVSATLSPGVKQLFQQANFASIATLMPDGFPHSTIVWVDLEGDRILVNTAEGRVKPRNVRRDPRVAVSIFSMENPYASASVRGRVTEMRHRGADEHIDRLAQKYLGREKYPFRAPGERRVILVIEPERVSSSVSG